MPVFIIQMNYLVSRGKMLGRKVTEQFGKLFQVTPSE